MMTSDIENVLVRDRLETKGTEVINRVNLLRPIFFALALLGIRQPM